MTETTDAPTWVKANPFTHDETLNHVEMSTPAEVNIPQLAEEITAALKLPEASLLMATQVEDLNADVSEKNPTYIYFSSKEPLDSAVMADVLKRHVPAAPEVDTELETALTSLRAGETLNTQQISAVLKSIIGG